MDWCLKLTKTFHSAMSYSNNDVDLRHNRHLPHEAKLDQYALPQSNNVNHDSPVPHFASG